MHPSSDSPSACSYLCSHTSTSTPLAWKCRRHAAPSASSCGGGGHCPSGSDALHASQRGLPTNSGTQRVLCAPSRAAMTPARSGEQGLRGCGARARDAACVATPQHPSAAGTAPGRRDAGAGAPLPHAALPQAADAPPGSSRGMAHQAAEYSAQATPASLRSTSTTSTTASRPPQPAVAAAAGGCAMPCTVVAAASAPSLTRGSAAGAMAARERSHRVVSTST